MSMSMEIEIEMRIIYLVLPTTRASLSQVAGGRIKIWDGSTPALDLRSTKTIAHEDRIMLSVAMHMNRNMYGHGDGDGDSARTTVCQMASDSIDLTGKL